MKTIITYLMLILSIMTHAQKPLDTIYTNDHKTVALFFPKQIRQGVTGAENFLFTYNRENEQYLGLLQATPGDESNLLVVTSDGNVYSYILKYAKTVTKLNFFINGKDRVGTEKPEQEISIDNVDSLKINKDKSNYYRRFSESLLKAKHYPLTSKRDKGMVLKLLKMVYDKNEVYLVMEIKNNSGIDFELDYLNISIVKGNKGCKASSQRLEENIIYKYKTPSIILNGGSNQFVFVVPKFVLGNKEKLQIEVKELNGSRKLTLETKNQQHF